MQTTMERLSIYDVEFRSTRYCEGKYGYETYRKAKIAMEHHKHRIYTKSALMVYHCNECGLYHLGNDSVKG